MYKARELAAKRGKSLSTLIREQLEALTQEKNELEKVTEEILAIMQEHSGVDQMAPRRILCCSFWDALIVSSALEAACRTCTEGSGAMLYLDSSALVSFM